MKLKLLPLFIIICSANAFAQPTIKTQKLAGGTSSDNLTSTWLTKDGGFIAGDIPARANREPKLKPTNAGLITVVKYGQSKYYLVKQSIKQEK